MSAVMQPNPAAAAKPAARRWPRVHPAQLLVAALLLVFPSFASEFFLGSIAAQSMLLGLIALSITWLAGYGGMVSLAQMTAAGCAGYMLALFGVNSTELGLGWPWWIALPMALVIATLFGTFVGALAVRTQGIYTIMITLAIAVAFFYLTRQNYAVFNGFNGFSGIEPPPLLGVDWTAPVPFYYLTLGLAAIGYFAVVYIGRSTFGLALQGIRDNPRRMEALGFNVTAHRITAYSFGGLLAAIGGVLLVWFNGRISPGTIAVGPVIDILVIAVIGGLRHPIGAFIGALVFVLLDNFAMDLIDRERFNLVIGTAFLLIVLFSPDGLLGLWQKFKNRIDSFDNRLS